MLMVKFEDNKNRAFELGFDSKGKVIKHAHPHVLNVSLIQEAFKNAYETKQEIFLYDEMVPGVLIVDMLLKGTRIDILNKKE